MATKKQRRRNQFRQLERGLTMVILADLVLFILTLAAGGSGIGWLKVIVGLCAILISGLGGTFLVLINEHKRRRSWWMLSAFASLLVCTLVSLITGGYIIALFAIRRKGFLKKTIFRQKRCIFWKSMI